jgi:hypothetical protein
MVHRKRGVKEKADVCIITFWRISDLMGRRFANGCLTPDLSGSRSRTEQPQTHTHAAALTLRNRHGLRLAHTRSTSAWPQASLLSSFYIIFFSQNKFMYKSTNGTFFSQNQLL